MNGVAEWLKKEGPMLSGELARLYEETYGVSNESARKAISRAKSPVQNCTESDLKKIRSFVIWIRSL